MKKKIPALLLLIVMVAGLFTVSTSAERKEGLPINLKDSSMWIELTINSFEVTGAENIPGRYLNRVHYHMTHTPGYSWTVEFICYNSSGIPLGTVTTTLGYYDTETLGYVDVWDTTATIEIAAVNPVMDSQSYLYRNYVNVYSLDGRVLSITDLQVPVYELVGWSRGVTMHAFENGAFTRSIEIHPAHQEAYRNVGWYTEEERHNAVTLYAYDGVGAYSKEITVPERLVPAYRNVGWKTKEEIRKTALPVVVRTKDGKTIIFTEFDIKGPYVHSSFTEFGLTVKSENKDNAFWEADLHMYDHKGKYLGTINDLRSQGTNEDYWIIISDRATAMFEFVVRNIADGSESYFHCKYVNVYSPDGRVMSVTDLQVPTYELVGWSRGVTMYAFENGNFDRTIEISPYEVEAYKKVGWYTKEDVDNAVTMYAPGSRKMRVPADQVWLYRKVGWNTKKVVSTDSWRNMNIRVAGYRKFNDDPLNYEFAMGARKFTEDYGTKVTFMVGGGDGMGEDLVAAIVSGKPWDIQYAFGISVFPMAFEEGLYTPITEYIDFNDEGVDEITANGAKWKGEYYGISCLPMQEIHYMAYNETWMKRLGLKTPYEYYKEGNWNLDTYKVLNEKATALGAPIRSSYTRPHTTTMYMTSWDETRGRVTVTYDSPENHRWLSYWASLLTDRRYNIKGGGFVSKRNSIMRDEVMPNLMKDELTQYTNDVIRYIHYPNMDGGTGSYLTDSHFVFPVGVKGDRLACAVKLASYMSAEKGKISLDNYRTYMNSADFELFKKNMNDAYYLPRIFYSGAFASGSVFRNDIARGKSVATHIAEQTRILNVEASEYNRKYAD